MGGSVPNVVADAPLLFHGGLFLCLVWDSVLVLLIANGGMKNPHSGESCIWWLDGLMVIVKKMILSKNAIVIKTISTFFRSGLLFLTPRKILVVHLVVMLMMIRYIKVLIRMMIRNIERVTLEI